MQRLKVYPMPDGWYLHSTFFGKQNVFEDGLQLFGSDSHESLNLTFSPGGQIEGLVLRGDDPAYGALVRLFPQPANPNHTDLFKVVPTDKDDHFVINSVAPGCYRVVAYASERTDGTGDHGSPSADSVTACIIMAEKEFKNSTVQLQIE